MYVSISLSLSLYIYIYIYIYVYISAGSVRFLIPSCNPSPHPGSMSPTARSHGCGQGPCEVTSVLARSCIPRRVDKPCYHFARCWNPFLGTPLINIITTLMFIVIVTMIRKTILLSGKAQIFQPWLHGPPNHNNN